jgi:carboxyl-terminal processing protease
MDSTSRLPKVIKMKTIHCGIPAFAILMCSVLLRTELASAQEILRVKPTSDARAAELKSKPWIDVIQREVAPLKNDPGRQMPMVMWHGVGFEPLPPEKLKILQERGLTQHLQMDAAMIPAALNLQRAGMPVILMQGRTDSWPYSLADDAADWAHQFDITYQPKWFGDEDAFEWHGACPNQTAGWKILQQNTLETMHKFRDAGVKVSGVWMDWEGDPYPWTHLFEQLKHCQRCRRDLPAEIVYNQVAWRDASWQRYVKLYDEHFAQPIHEVFPDCLVTNWHVVASTQKKPIRYFVSDVLLPELSPRFFNATNPIGYGSDSVWRSRYHGADPPTQQVVDDFFANEITQQIDTDFENRSASKNREMKSVPWVARYCRIEPSGPMIPLMTRKRYRETLGELWTKDIATMQVFNAMHEGFEEYAIFELQDAVQAFDNALSKASLNAKR